MLTTRITRRRVRRYPSSPPRQDRLSLEEASEHHLYHVAAQNCAPHTISLYRRTEHSFLAYLRERGYGGRIPLSALNVDNARGWLIQLRPRLAPNTLHLYAVILRAWANWLEADGYCDDSPLRKLKMPRKLQRRIVPFSAEQVTAMFAAAEASRDYPTRNVALLAFMLATGVRCAEMTGLHLADVNLSERHALVMGKGSRERRVWFDATTEHYLRRYLATRDDDEPWLFLPEGGGRWAPRGVTKVFDGLKDRSGVTGVRCSPHTCRHTFAINFLRIHPGAVFQLQRLLGHADLDMTRRYCDVVDADTRLPGPSVLDYMGVTADIAPTPPRAGRPLTCLRCGAAFRGAGTRDKYCSMRCYLDVKNERRRRPRDGARADEEVTLHGGSALAQAGLPLSDEPSARRDAEVSSDAGRR
jgi:integrase/recombinase XerC